MRSNQLLKLILVFITFFVYMNPLLGQNSQADSLLRLVNPNKPDTANAKIYYELARTHYSSDTRNALNWAREAAKYYKKADNLERMTRCMNIEAVCLLILDKPDESIKLHYQILKIREELKDTLAISETLLNIGNVYYRGQDKEQAIKFYKRSKKFAALKNNTKMLGSLSNNIGNYYMDIYLQTNKVQYKNQAIQYLKESIVYKKKLKTDPTLDRSYNALARVYFHADEIDQAYNYASVAQRIAKQDKDHESVGSSHLLLASIALKRKNPDLAQSLLDDLHIYITENKAFHILNLFDEEILQLRSQVRNVRSNNFIELDSLRGDSYENLLLARQKVREELNIKYETEKKELENANLALKNKIQESKAQLSKTITLILIVFALALVIFIFSLKKKNKAIIKSQKSIEKQASQLAHQNTLLKQSEAFKAKLFSIVSHDLKSPINSLKIFVDLSSQKNLSSEDFDYLMENLKQELDITSSLLDDLLYWSKAQMQTNSIAWSNFDLSAVVNKCIYTLSPNIKLKQLKIKNLLNQNLIIWGDEKRCEFIVRNILHNAIKYSEFYKEIEIGVFENTSSWDFYIKDNGIGISEDRLEKLFESNFSKGGTKGTLDEQGAGIGLLLCNDFVESLYWKLHVESKLAAGTISHISIPKNPASASSSAGTQPQVQASKPIKNPIHSKI